MGLAQFAFELMTGIYHDGKKPGMWAQVWLEVVAFLHSPNL